MGKNGYPENKLERPVLIREGRVGFGYFEVHLSEVILTPFDGGCIDIATGELVRLSAFGHPSQSPATTASPIENAPTRKEVPPTADTPDSSSSAQRFPTFKNSPTSRLIDTLNRSCSGGKGGLPSIIALICSSYRLGSYFGNSPPALAIATPFDDFGGSRGTTGSKKPSPYISIKYLRRIRSRSAGP
jgi:hypothetical protein